MTTTRDFFAHHALDRALIDRFLDSSAHNWARFDPELGYLHADYAMRDGIDGSCTLNTMGRDGARTAVAFAGRSCRINTYGNSFTHCDQVNDGETWQEYLAAHLLEPIRNFGTGGHGVYQAWRRMQREEGGANAADHLILNLFEDDHRRSVMAWRWLDLWPGYARQCRMVAASGSDEVAYFHNNPWDHLAWDLEGGDFVERRSLCPAPADLARLCDPEWLRDRFAADLHANLIMARARVVDLDPALLRAHAEAFALPFDASTPDALAASAERVYNAVALRSTLWVLERARGFASATGKKLLVLMSYAAGGVVAALRGEPRPDAIVVERVRALGLPIVDIRDHHLADFGDFRCDPETYARRYWNGHYAPRGNHFFAYAIKDAVVALLDPAPRPYRGGGESLARVAAGLNGGAARPGD